MKNRKKKKLISLIIYIILIIILMIASLIFFYSKSDDSLYGPYSVTSVIDGDTLLVKINGKDTKIRLIGINSPESVHYIDSYNSDEGKEASNQMKTLVGNSKVYLEYDEGKFDQYGRTLAYVYLNDKVTMLNKEMVRLGYAKVILIEPNDRHYNELLLIEKEAKKEKAGLWGTGYYY